MRIDWNLPSFRAGFLGGLDKIIGPGATSAEKNLQLYIPFIAGALIALMLITQSWAGLGVNTWQRFC